MKYNFFIHIILCFTLFTAGLTRSQAQHLSFGHIDKSDGLSNYSVTSIYQDKRGLMWFGTANGINLYNGNSIKTYQKSRSISNGPCDNHVKYIVGNKKDCIFFGTMTGVSAYDLNKEKFSTIFGEGADCLIFNKFLYLAHKNRIFRYDGHEFKPFRELPQECHISSLSIKEDSMLVGTKQNGLYLFHHEKLIHLIPQGNVTSIFCDSYGTCWITNSRDGSGIYIIQNGKIRNIKNYKGKPNILSSNFTHCCCEDKQGNIWIGTINGLTLYDREKNKFVCYTPATSGKGLSYPSIWSLYCDVQGTIWAGTFYGGINYFNPQEQQPYHEYHISIQEKNGLSSGVICRMTEDNENNLWICTEGGGLNKYNRKSHTFKWFRKEDNFLSVSSNNIKAIYYDSLRQELYLGTHLGGLNKLNLRNGKFTHFRHNANNPRSISSDIVLDIIPYKNHLLLATHNGINIFHPGSGQCRPLISNKQDRMVTMSPSQLLLDKTGLLWIVNIRDGVCTYNTESKKLLHYKHDDKTAQSISSNLINSIFEDSRQRIWLCTNDNGIDMYHRSNNSFENFNSAKNGLLSDVVYNICELAPDSLLMTTDKGISIFDCRSQTCTNYANIPLDFLKSNALYRSKDGEIFIGGVSGMISFRPNSLEEPSGTYNLFPDRLIVNDQEIAVDDPSGILSANLSNTDKITLNAKQNLFQIGYAITNYLPFNEDVIYYRLEGFSNQWNLMNEQCIVTYSNLSPGTYTLIAKAQDKSGKTTAESQLKIQVLPPFYRSFWAYLIYTFCITATVFWLLRVYKHRIKLQEMLKYEQQHTDDVEKLTQSKLRFFTNISHEFRTPLTLIISQMEIILHMQSFSPNLHNKLKSVYKNSLQLKELIDELLDFRKQEQGHMYIKVKEHNIVKFLYTTFLAFQEYASQKKITFDFQKTCDSILCWYDEKQMRKVFNNLLSNAFKHTPEGGRITVSIKKRNQEILIEVTDNGDGIRPEDIEKIFDRFYQTEHLSPFSSGTGIGLALTKGIIELHHGHIEVFSEPEEGSTFCIHLKNGNAHFTPEELDNGTPENYAVEQTATTDPEQKPLAVLPAKEKATDYPNAKPYKMLVVEDNDSLRQMLDNVFNPFYEIITAKNGKEALEMVKSDHPDIVISDVLMPMMSGTQLCQAIKRDIETCHIPVVLLTAQTSPEHTIAGFRYGADDYITKPFNVNVLLSRCNSLVNNRIMTREHFSKEPYTAPRILGTSESEDLFLKQLTEMIEQHIDDPDFKVNALTEKMNMARTKLYTRLKLITGETPSEFIMSLRLKKAADMLVSQPQLTISEVADRLGFSTPRYFSKCFKEKYHIIPQEFRKIQSEK